MTRSKSSHTPEAAEAVFTGSHLEIVKFCAKECELQQSGEVSVSWMVEAWSYAQTIRRSFRRLPDEGDIGMLGMLVEPVKNKDGYRKVGVRVGWSVKMDWHLVPSSMESLLAVADSATPEEFFREYEEVHPFRDGNGRTGQILYNWLRGTLHEPVFAPNFWADERRHVLPTAVAASSVHDGVDLPDPSGVSGLTDEDMQPYWQGIET